METRKIKFIGGFMDGAVSDIGISQISVDAYDGNTGAHELYMIYKFEGLARTFYIAIPCSADVDESLERLFYAPRS